MCLCFFLFPCALLRCKHGRRYKEKEKKIVLSLALAVMLTLACFHDMHCFTCAYAYACACVTNENKAFIILPLHCFYASLRIMLALFM